MKKSHLLEVLAIGHRSKYTKSWFFYGLASLNRKSTVNEHHHRSISSSPLYIWALFDSSSLLPLTLTSTIPKSTAMPRGKALNKLDRRMPEQWRKEGREIDSANVGARKPANTVKWLDSSLPRQPTPSTSSRRYNQQNSWTHSCSTSTRVILSCLDDAPSQFFHQCIIFSRHPLPRPFAPLHFSFGQYSPARSATHHHAQQNGR